MRMNIFAKRDHAIYLGVLFDWVCRIITVLTFLEISISSIQNSIKKTWSTNWLTPVSCFFLFILLMIILRVCKKNSHLIIRTLMNMFARKSRYKYKNWEITYEYVSPTEMNFRAEYSVQALETDVDSIRVRCNWSGWNNTFPLSPSPIKDPGFSTKCVEYVGKEFGYFFYKVSSTSRINHGDSPIKLGIRLDSLKDLNNTASPHLLANIAVETDELVLNVILPHQIVANNVECYEYIHATDDFHWHKYSTTSPNSPIMINRIDNNRTMLIWKIQKPILGGKYIIKWIPQLLTE